MTASNEILNFFILNKFAFVSFLPSNVLYTNLYFVILSVKTL